MEPAPLIVPLPPPLEPEELDDPAPDELELELELLEPHAATASDALTNSAIALMRLVLKVISFSRLRESLWGSTTAGVNQL